MVLHVIDYDKLYSPYNGSIIKIVKKNLTNLTIY